MWKTPRTFLAFLLAAGPNKQKNIFPIKINANAAE
jgi:hypothetical protein